MDYLNTEKYLKKLYIPNTISKAKNVHLISNCIGFWSKILSLDLAGMLTVQAGMLTVQTLIYVVMKYQWFQVSSCKKFC